MARKWRNDDLALVEVPTRSTPGGDINATSATRLLVTRTSSGWASISHPNYYWADDYAFFSYGPTPVVVIDPEDRGQVGQLTKAIVEAAYQHGNLPVSDNGIAEDTTSLALRSLILPPKPEEPTGLGAVVEDGEGHRWTKARSSVTGWCSSHGIWREWDRVAAVEVLSPGVAA